LTLEQYQACQALKAHNAPEELKSRAAVQEADHRYQGQRLAAEAQAEAQARARADARALAAQQELVIETKKLREATERAAARSIAAQRELIRETKAARKAAAAAGHSTGTGHPVRKREERHSDRKRIVLPTVRFDTK
jgi:hypothetical protein